MEKNGIINTVDKTICKNCKIPRINRTKVIEVAREVAKSGCKRGCERSAETEKEAEYNRWGIHDNCLVAY